MQTQRFFHPSKRHYLFSYLLMISAFCFQLVGCGSAEKPEEATESTAESAGADSTSVADTNQGFQASQAAGSGKQTILFFGNSITAGYELELSEAFPALLQERIDSLGWPFQTVNAGLSGETTASGKSRITWVLQEPVDVFVLELGANDGLRGIDLAESRKNLDGIFKQVKQSYPSADLLLAGMQIPPNMGGQYTTAFRAMFPAVAEAQGAVLIPFLLEGVAGNPSLNLSDGIHPTAEGHRILADNIWAYLRPVLQKRMAE